MVRALSLKSSIRFCSIQIQGTNYSHAKNKIMKMQELIKNNVLIAMFMNSEKSGSYWYLPQHEEVQEIPRSYDCERVSHFGDEELKYHKDWNWLMTVIDEIDVLNDYAFTVNMHYHYTTVTSEKHNISIDSEDDSGRLMSTYKAVIEFIKWYNKNN